MINYGRFIRVVGALACVTGFLQAHADSLAVLHHFDGNDGTSPTGLVLASNGNLYGAATTGGDREGCLAPDGCGTLFRMSPSGKLKVLHVFEGTDGYYPGGVVEGPDGRLYGETRLGGQADRSGGGVLFSISLAGKDFRIHHRFGDGSVCCDGARPQPGMILASDGMLYGTTELGGDFRDVDHLGFGMVFRLDPATRKIVPLHSFQLADGNGIFPNGYVMQASDGEIYGTTREGGSAGGGTMWRMNTDGSGFQVVAQLPNMETHSGPVQTVGGDLVGTEDVGSGSVYSVRGGNVAFVNRFDNTDGKGLFYPVTQGADTLMYGTTQQGGLLDPQGGVVFRLAGDGSLRVLHSFASAASDGIIPNARLLEGAAGKLYGTTALGGELGRGTIFAIDFRDLGPVKAVSAPEQIQSGRSSTGKVTLFKAAPPGGTVVSLNAGFASLSVPATVTVPAGRKSASFTIKSSKVGVQAHVRIYASVGGQGTRDEVIVNP